MAVPMWREQTSLARGYGLSFGAAALLVVGLLRLAEELNQPSTRTMSFIFAGVLVGSLAHFFFVFFVIGALVVVGLARELTAATRLAVSWWIALALLVPAISFALGAPAIAVQMGTLSTPGLPVLAQRFLDEFTFREHGRLGTVFAVSSLTLIVAAIVALPARARRAVSLVLLFMFAGPMLANPVYLYPRFFVHALPVVAPCIAWLICVRIGRGKLFLSVASVGALIAIWGLTGWDAWPYVDLRRAAAVARAESRDHGARFAVDTVVSSGVRFYNGTAGRIVNMSHAIPADVERILFAPVHATPVDVPPGFAIAERFIGTDHDVVLVARY
jgi:hypothetical protein